MNKTLLSLFKGKLFLIFFVLISSVSFSQTTLFQFDFESNTGTAIPNIDNVIGNGNYDVYLIKTNSSGDTLWTKTIGGLLEDYGYGVKQTSDGGYIVTGFSRNFFTV